MCAGYSKNVASFVIYFYVSCSVGIIVDLKRGVKGGVGTRGI